MAHHNSVELLSDLQINDTLFYRGDKVSIYRITDDNGILLSNGVWVCRSDLYEVVPSINSVSNDAKIRFMEKYVASYLAAEMANYPKHRDPHVFAENNQPVEDAECCAEMAWDLLNKHCSKRDYFK